MRESAYKILLRVLQDNDEEASRVTAGQLLYRDGLQAASARIRAAMAGLPRDEPAAGPHDSGGGGGGGWDDGEPPPKAPSGDGGGGKVIEAEYTISDPDAQKVAVRVYPP